MRKFLVSGLINIETTLKVERFPLEYQPVRFPFFGVRSTVSGVGMNVSKALTILGNSVQFLSLVGGDYAGEMVLKTLRENGIATEHVLTHLDQTCQSVILYDPQGQRAIFTDLKDIQEKTYPPQVVESALVGCDLAVLCNINFSRAMLKPARRAGVMIATDVHTLSSLDDAYNQDFLAAANILFLSHENLPCPPEDFIRQIWGRYQAEIVVIGMGSQGALLGVRSDQRIERTPALQTRPIVNTIGAGDALFSAFLHNYLVEPNPYMAIRKAVTFASYKIGTTGAAEGFLTQPELEQLFLQVAAQNETVS